MKVKGPENYFTVFNSSLKIKITRHILCGVPMDGCYIICLFLFCNVNFQAPVGIFGKQRSMYSVSCKNWLHRATCFAI